MKPAPFAYVRADTLDDVFQVLDRHGDGARILAGGQSLMATLNMRLSTPEVLVDIGRVADLAGIEDTGDTIRIGAMTRHVEVETSALVADHAPLFTSAMPHIAHPAIRNRGTLGGSIAFADPAAELPACSVALESRMSIAGRDGTRTVEAAAFFRGLYETAVGPGEILTAVEVPKIAPGWKSGFMELARRHGTTRSSASRPTWRSRAGVSGRGASSSSAPATARSPPHGHRRCSRGRPGRTRSPPGSRTS